MTSRLALGLALTGTIVAVALSASLPAPLRLAAAIAAIVAAVLLAIYVVSARGEKALATSTNVEGATNVEGTTSVVPRSAPAVPATIAPVDQTNDPDLAEVLAALPLGVMVIGNDGKISSFNAAASELFGVSTDRARDRALIEIVRNFELDRRVTATLRAGVEETGELTYTGARERDLQVTTRVLARAGGARNALVIIADQTRMRELEKLRQEFVSNVSHELRTPLTAVKLMVETLQSGVERPASDEFLGSIAQETERMIALVEDLLDLARLESGKLELRLSSVDVASLAREVVQAHVQRAEMLGITLECSVPDVPITISADRDKLYQVIINLLDNALRHTPAGGRVTVMVQSMDTSVEIAVSDTGSGIPSTALPHIFERFYVVDPARARGRSGTGLGLAIVKHIIEAHGGTISATSELGMGTTFHCRFAQRT